MDRLATLLDQFAFTASTFHQGSFCGIDQVDGSQPVGHVHLLRAGSLRLRDGLGPPRVLDEPSLILMIRPRAHELSAGESDGADLVCATLAFTGGPDNPLTRALPDVLVSPLRDLPQVRALCEWLFAETLGDECGKGLVLNRLFELLVIQLLRDLLGSQGVTSGMLAGLADKRLARALVALHEAPALDWSVQALAALAGMSRAGFAAHFKAVVGDTPGDYLAGWRIALAQKRIRDGRPLALVADEVGYQSPSALARVFRRKTGMSPGQWRQQV
ncbi:AraC family transcriptional regulator [Pseudomonas sp. UFMG81]|uniref:AraC family transcriptional regulator n=1 Tax=Pseudomonas sp. UFMG81 TaxID=2745936 RepID=UPI00188F96C2|nr:AraC family transcriptional regulator [Pseudomonas sp. UFMG81]